MKITDFDENRGFWQKSRDFDRNPQILMKTADFGLITFSGRFKVRNCKNYISKSIFNRTTSNTEIHRFLSEMKDYLPKKVTPIFFILCTQLTPFKTIWLNFIIVYPIDYFQYHMTRCLYCVPSWLLSRQYDLISVLCTQMTPFKTIWPNFIILFLTPFKTIWPNFALWTQLTPFKTIWPDFCIGYSIESFQDHMTWFLYWVHSRLISRPYDLIFVLCTWLTPFKTIWPNFIIVYPIDSIEDHMIMILYCDPKWLLFKTIWPDFLYCVHNRLLSRPLGNQW